MMTVNGSPRFIERFAVSIGTLVLIVAQTVAVVAWLVNDHAQITRLTEEAGVLRSHIDAVDNNGTRFGTQFINRITQSEAQIIAANRHFETINKRIDDLHDIAQSDELASGRIQGQIDLLKQEDGRIEEQQTRILQALDNTYNLLQEHLRLHGNGERGPPDLKLKR